VALTPGTRIGFYEISAQIGEGGMGVVYRATDTRLKRDVAIKVLPEALAGDPERLSRLQREAEVLASLNHHGIAAIYGVEETPSTGSGQAASRALVMELVEGPTLADRLATGAIPVEETLKLGLQIAEALEAAHAQGIIHRDLKPANVKVTPDGRVKVLDFGLAKAFEAQQDRPELTHSPTLSLAATQQGLILGTAGYMAPEQASGLPADRRADVWAFGVVLFEMLTGRQMFTGQTTAHILAGVLRADPQWDGLPANLHPRIRLMLERCLEKDPRNRYHDIADARVDLERVLADPHGALVAAAGAPAAHEARRSMLPFVAAAVLAVVAAFAGAWYLKPVEQPRVVRLDHHLPEGATFYNTVLPAVAISPDSRRVAYNTAAGIEVLSLDQFESRVIPGTVPTAANVAQVMFSPDGEWIGYVSAATGQLQKVSVSGGAPVSLAPVASAGFAGGSWGADDRIVYAQGRDIVRVPGSGGAPEVLFQSTGIPAWPQVLPDGRTILYCDTTNVASGGQTMIRSLEDGTETSFPGCGAQYLSSGHLAYAVGDDLFVQPFDLGSRTLGGGPVSLVEGVLNAFLPQFSVSATGALAYLPGGVEVAQNRVLGIVGLDGLVQVLDGIPPGPYSSPRVSPDGSRVVFQGTEGVPLATATSTIFVYDLSGDTAVLRLTQSGKNFHPIWTPDSRRLTFASDRGGTPGIFWQPADGSGAAERLTTVEPPFEHWPDAWSPDGGTLVYQVVEPGSYDVDLWRLSPEAPEQTEELIVGMSRQHGALFSPDGRWLAYGALNTPDPEQIYVQPFPATGASYQLTRESGAFAVWSPDGRYLFYRRNATTTAGETAPGLFQVEIVPGERFAWRNERRLPFENFLVFGGLRDYDVLPDGRFVMLFPAETGAAGDAERPRFNVVLNWFEEVKARVRAN
jgi:serine/threonine-protein kinase